MAQVIVDQLESVAVGFGLYFSFQILLWFPKSKLVSAFGWNPFQKPLSKPNLQDPPPKNIEPRRLEQIRMVICQRDGAAT